MARAEAQQFYENYTAAVPALQKGKSYTFGQFFTRAAQWFRDELRYNAACQLLFSSDREVLSPCPQRVMGSHDYALGKHLAMGFIWHNRGTWDIPRAIQKFVNDHAIEKLRAVVQQQVDARQQEIKEGGASNLGDPEDPASGVVMLRILEQIYKEEMRGVEGEEWDGELPAFLERDLEDLQPKVPERGGPKELNFHGLLFNVNYELGVILML